MPAPPHPPVAPTVSVCVPVYNASRYVDQTLASVFAQTYDDWELVILDDASPDDSWDVVQRHAGDPRVRLARHERNQGAAATWNEVVGMARGRYVKVLCSDDLLSPDSLAIHVALLDAHPSAVLAAARRNIIDEHGAALIKDRGLGGLRGLVPGAEARRAIVRAGTNPLGEPSVVLFRRAQLLAVGGFDPQWRFTIDLDAYARVLEHGDLVAADATLGSFRVSPTQWSAALERDQRRENHEFVSRLAVASGLSRRGWSARRGRATASALSVGRSLVYRRLRRRARL